MARICYRGQFFRGKSYGLIETANTIIDEYLGAGMRLTLRQLYYQFVAHHAYPNTERSYKSLASLISDARIAGMVDWDAIEDRGRRPDICAQWDGIPNLVKAALYSYRLPRWKGQDYYVELWVEKQALAGVLEPLAEEFHITLMVNKGYSSSSAMHESAQRFRQHAERDCILLYLGDHDPSGEDMVRDIEERMELFDAEVAVKKIGLTMTQIKKYSPPPNPAKVTDPRAKKYIAKHGRSSWEVDALNPKTLAALIRSEVSRYLDRDKMDKIIAIEDRDKKKLVTLVKKTWKDKKQPKPKRRGRKAK